MRNRILMCLAGILIVAGGGLGVWLTVETQNNRLVWDHFDVVKHGILYRSGQLNPDQLEKAIDSLGLKTVVSFQLPGEGVARERAIARRKGIDFINLPMPGDGFGQEKQFREVLKAVDDPARRPVLVHCARGTCRTGAAVALYRFERDGWTIDDVAAEMRRQVYREGWLPGYVFNMVTKRPAQERFEPRFVHDRNLPEPLPSPVEAVPGPDSEHGHDHRPMPIEVGTSSDVAPAVATESQGKERSHVR